MSLCSISAIKEKYEIYSPLIMEQLITDLKYLKNRLLSDNIFVPQTYNKRTYPTYSQKGTKKYATQIKLLQELNKEFGGNLVFAKRSFDKTHKYPVPDLTFLGQQYSTKLLTFTLLEQTNNIVSTPSISHIDEMKLTPISADEWVYKGVIYPSYNSALRAKKGFEGIYRETPNSFTAAGEVYPTEQDAINAHLDDTIEYIENPTPTFNPLFLSDIDFKNVGITNQYELKLAKFRAKEAQSRLLFHDLSTAKEWLQKTSVEALVAPILSPYINTTASKYSQETASRTQALIEKETLLRNTKFLYNTAKVWYNTPELQIASKGAAKTQDEQQALTYYIQHVADINVGLKTDNNQPYVAGTSVDIELLYQTTPVTPFLPSELQELAMPYLSESDVLWMYDQFISDNLGTIEDFIHLIEMSKLNPNNTPLTDENGEQCSI